MPKTTVDLVRAEGNFYKEQFDKATQQDFEALLDQRIDEAAVEVEREVGSEHYNSSDPVTDSLLCTAETYLACAKCLQTIESIIATWDREQLPSEFVSAEHVAQMIERYRRLAKEILDQFDTTFDEAPKPYLAAE
jgi:hypothetical protein